MDMAFQDILTAHHHYLIRWFTKLTCDPQTADELAQQTLIEAWKNRHKLTDAQGAVPWINAIAAYIYKRWGRTQKREQRHVLLTDEAASPVSLEMEIDHEDLLSLLDSALERLPTETQALLIARYLEGLPYIQLAERLGVSEAVIGVRLHRGKLLLRQLIEREMNSTLWRTTRLWCAVCGCTTYESYFDPAAGELHLRCPRCTPAAQPPAWSHTETPQYPVIQCLTSLKPAFHRVMAAHDGVFRPALAQPLIPCERCGTATPLHRRPPAFLAQNDQTWVGVHYVCGACGHLNYSGLGGIALSTPQGRAFWKRHPRIAQQPLRFMRYDGREAFQLTAHSVTSAATFSVIFAQETYEILAIEGANDHD